jgi:hypothetical protein
MDIEIEGYRYEILIGTDVSRLEARNGAFIEMHALDTPGTNPLLFACPLWHGLPTVPLTWTEGLLFR